MRKYSLVPLSTLIAQRCGSVDPLNFQDEQFELYSIPAYDSQKPDRVFGREIGSTKQVLAPGDVLLSKIVPHIRRSWVVGANNGLRIIGSGEWIVFRGSECHAPYLRHVLLGNQFHSEFMSTVSGVGGSLLRAKPAQVAEIKIPLPPLPEQQRIAAILDHADALRAKRRAAIAKLDSLSQSIFFDMFGDPVTNPKSWGNVSLEEATSKITDGEHLSPKFSLQGMPMVMAGNVLDHGVDLPNAKTVSLEDGFKFRKKCGPERGDVLLVSRGATIGRLCVVDVDNPFSLMGSVILIKTKGSLLQAKYLTGFLKLPTVRMRLFNTSGSSAQQAIYLKDLKHLMIPSPPIQEQIEFSNRYSGIEMQRKQYEGSLEKLDALFTSLQHRAFQGDL